MRNNFLESNLIYKYNWLETHNLTQTTDVSTLERTAHTINICFICFGIYTILHLNNLDINSLIYSNYLLKTHNLTQTTNVSTLERTGHIKNKNVIFICFGIYTILHLNNLDTNSLIYSHSYLRTYVLIWEFFSSVYIRSTYITAYFALYLTTTLKPLNNSVCPLW